MKVYRIATFIIISIFILGLNYNTHAQTQENNIVKKANKLYSSGFYDVALKLYTTLLGTEFNDSDLERQISKCHYKLKDFPNAAYWYEKVIKNSDYNEDDVLNYANILKLNKNYKLSKNYYELLGDYDYDVQPYFEQLKIAKQLNESPLPVTLNLVKLKFNSNETVATMHPNGLYFASDYSILGRGNFFNKNDFDIYLSKINSKNQIYSTEKAKGSLNTAANEIAISFQNGKKAFVTKQVGSNNDYFNDMVKTNNFVKHRYEIVEYKMKNGKFNSESSSGFNSYNSSNAFPAFSKDGKIVIFSSNRLGGYGGYDLYYSISRGSKGWSDPVNLGNEINTSFDEMHAHLDGKDNLYFSSDGHISIGNLDVYIAKRQGKKWVEPKNLGTPINSSFDDYGIIINQNATTGFFTSDRNNGKKNIYSFAINDAVSFDQQYLNSYSSKSLRVDKPVEFDIVIRAKNDVSNNTYNVKIAKAKTEPGKITTPIVEKEVSIVKEKSKAIEKEIVVKDKIKKPIIKVKEKTENLKEKTEIAASKIDPKIANKYVIFFTKVNSPTILQFILADLGVTQTGTLKDGRTYNYLGFYDNKKVVNEVLPKIKARGFNSEIIGVKMTDLEKTVLNVFNNDEEKYNPLKNNIAKNESKSVDISKEHYRIELPNSQNPEGYLTVFKDIGTSLSQISPNNTDVYYLGTFETEKDAMNSLKSMKERGLSSGSITKFKNENRLTAWTKAQLEDKSIAKLLEAKDKKIKVPTNENGKFIIVLAATDNADVYKVVLKDVGDVIKAKRKDGSEYQYLGKYASKDLAKKVMESLNKRGFESIQIADISKGEIPMVEIKSEEVAEVIDLDAIPNDSELAKQFKKKSLKTTYLIKLIDIQNPALYELIFKPYGRIVQRTENEIVNYYLGEFYTMEDAKQVQENIKKLGLQTPTEIEEF